MCISTAGCGIAMTAGSDHAVYLVLDRDDSTDILFLTSLTPFTSLAYLVAKSFSAEFSALPVRVTTPFFVVTEVLWALVER
jgi:hypothetical protein